LGEWPVAYIHRLEGIYEMGCVYTDVTSKCRTTDSANINRQKND